MSTTSSLNGEARLSPEVSSNGIADDGPKEVANNSNGHQDSTPFNDEEDNNPFSHSQIANGIANGDDANEESDILYETQAVDNSIQINSESRVSRLLRPSSKVKIHIVEANNSSEGLLNPLKKYVVYTIKLINTENAKDEVQTRRRYSDFESLREILTKVFPLIIIPPIPPKNYINFQIFNNLVPNKPVSSTSKQQVPNGGYSYINSTHLNSNKLIEHRKRLLTNFLNNCLEINQIRNLEFFSKFLDPNTNWQDEINLISNQLPKDIYHLNPENGLKTDPVYTHLPSMSKNLGFLNAILANSKKIGQKTGKLISDNDSNEQETDNELTPTDSIDNASVDQSVDTSHLDGINKKIMFNFIGLANDYTDLGSVFNSFSLLLTDSSSIGSKVKDQDAREAGKLNLILDNMGQVFDRSYITLNSLIGELETKFSEPLGEEVQYSTTLNFVNKFHKKKLKQQTLLEEELTEKRKTLEVLVNAEQENKRIEENVKRDQLSRNSQFKLNQKPQQQPQSKFKFPNLKKLTQYVSDIIDQNPEETRKQRITDLQTKITTLEKCQGIMMGDISYITEELNKNFSNFHKKQVKVIYEILYCYNGFIANWAKKNLDIWEEIRDEITGL